MKIVCWASSLKQIPTGFMSCSKLKTPAATPSFIWPSSTRNLRYIYVDASFFVLFSFGCLFLCWLLVWWASLSPRLGGYILIKLYMSKVMNHSFSFSLTFAIFILATGWILNNWNAFSRILFSICLLILFMSNSKFLITWLNFYLFKLL